MPNVFEQARLQPGQEGYSPYQTGQGTSFADWEMGQRAQFLGQNVNSLSALMNKTQGQPQNPGMSMSYENFVAQNPEYQKTLQTNANQMLQMPQSFKQPLNEVWGQGGGMEALGNNVQQSNVPMEFLQKYGMPAPESGSSNSLVQLAQFASDPAVMMMMAPLITGGAFGGGEAAGGAMAGGASMPPAIPEIDPTFGGALQQTAPGVYSAPGGTGGALTNPTVQPPAQTSQAPQPTQLAAIPGNTMTDVSAPTTGPVSGAGVLNSPLAQAGAAGGVAAGVGNAMGDSQQPAPAPVDNTDYSGFENQGDQPGEAGTQVPATPQWQTQLEDIFKQYFPNGLGGTQGGAGATGGFPFGNVLGGLLHAYAGQQQGNLQKQLLQQSIDSDQWRTSQPQAAGLFMNAAQNGIGNTPYGQSIASDVSRKMSAQGYNMSGNQMHEVAQGLNRGTNDYLTAMSKPAMGNGINYSPAYMANGMTNSLDQMYQGIGVAGQAGLQGMFNWLQGQGTSPTVASGAGVPTSNNPVQGTTNQGDIDVIQNLPASF